MKKFLWGLLFFSWSSYALANTPNLAAYFTRKSGCFILYDLTLNKILLHYNSGRCATRIPPDSTFKIPLSLMAFNEKLINENTLFKWDGKNKGLANWNKDQTPKSWLKNSAIWVSQELTPQLGLSKIKSYLKLFNYGNQDFTGDPGKNNGLTHAWLSSSLKISADEQLIFLKKLYFLQLPISKDAMVITQKNMFLETSPRGWELYAKTGSGDSIQKQGRYINHDKVPQDGWFVGYVSKLNQHTYLFIINFSDLQKPQTTEAGGVRAKELAKAILNELGLF